MTTATKHDKAVKGTPADPTDHSVGGTADEVRTKEAQETTEDAQEDQSIGAKLRRSKLFFIRNHNTGEDYVGISPQNDPKASDGDKLRSTVQALDGVAPRTGMIIKADDKTSFAVPEGYGLDAKPEDWAAINKPDGTPLFA